MESLKSHRHGVSAPRGGPTVVRRTRYLEEPRGPTLHHATIDGHVRRHVVIRLVTSDGANFHAVVARRSFLPDHRGPGFMKLRVMTSVWAQEPFYVSECRAPPSGMRVT